MKLEIIKVVFFVMSLNYNQKDILLLLQIVIFLLFLHILLLARFLEMPGKAVSVGDESVPLPVDFGGVVELLAYDLSTSEVAPGGMVELVTLWRVRDPDALGPVPSQHYGRAAAAFVHVLDAGDVIVAQEDSQTHDIFFLLRFFLSGFSGAVRMARVPRPRFDSIFNCPPRWSNRS